MFVCLFVFPLMPFKWLHPSLREIMVDVRKVQATGRVPRFLWEFKTYSSMNLDCAAGISMTHFLCLFSFPVGNDMLGIVNTR